MTVSSVRGLLQSCIIVGITATAHIEQGLSVRADSGLNQGEQAAADFFAKCGLYVQRFSKEEIRRSKTPDFRVFRNNEFVMFCEAKHLQSDDWPYKRSDNAAPAQIEGGVRADPIFNRLTNHVHEAVKRFASVNPKHEHPNTLFLANSDRVSDVLDLIAVLDGMFRAGSEVREPIYTRYSEGQIRKDKFTVDLFIWWNVWMNNEPQRVWHPSIHHQRVCELLGCDVHANLQVGSLENVALSSS
jgi:hypothetical protein